MVYMGRSSLMRGLARIVAVVVALAALGVPASAAAQRGYELVSPADKEQGDLTYQAPTTVSSDGGRIYFSAPAAFADAPANTLANNYLAGRGPTGWSTRSIDVPAPVRLFTNEVVYAFTRDLSTALFSASDPPVLVPGETTGMFDLYLRDTASNGISLVTGSPPVTADVTAGAPGVAWTSPDLKHVLFDPAGEITYFPGDPGDPNPWLYHANAQTGEVGFVALIPNEATPDPDDEIRVPGDGSFAVGAGAGTGVRNFFWAEHSVSDDGSRIFFSVTSRRGFGTRPGTAAQIYVRKDHGTPQARTVRVSAPEAGVTDPTDDWEAWFRAASADGGKVLFTSCQRLTADSTAEPNPDSFQLCGDPTPARRTESDLYLFRVDANGGAGDLVDLTTADPAGADVVGFLGASDDGSRAYFVARGNLAPGATGSGPKIYFWQEGAGVALVAELSPADDFIWDDQNRSLPGLPTFGLHDPVTEAYATPDGGHLAFSSVAALEPGFDNGGHSQVYLYDAESRSLACASCAGPAPPDADATLHNQVSNMQRSRSGRIVQRHLSDDGRRLFFETRTALVGRDINREVDVYEYDSTAGAVSLISSGDSGFQAHFTNASPSGDDAFFTTRKRLVGWDTDNLVDIYDARLGGGFPEPEPPPPGCGDDCQGAPAGAPSLASPQSSSLVGPGEPALAPRPSFRVLRLSRAALARLGRGRTVRLRVRVNRAGRVRVVARARVGRPGRAGGGRRVVSRMRPVARASRRARRAGAVRLPLKLSRRARRELAREGALRVTLSVRFARVREPSRMRLRLRRAQGARAGAAAPSAASRAAAAPTDGTGR